jgi:glycosyltransferase involved in cell wall biosynthesis
MRVLHVIHSVDPRSGGPSHAVRSMVRAQSDAGHQVALLTTTIQSSEPWQPRESYVSCMQEDPAFAGIELYLGRAAGRRPPWSRYAYTPQCRAWLARRLATPELAPQVVHIHGVFSHLTPLAARQARRAGIPYIVRPAGSFGSQWLRTGRTRWKRGLTRWFVRGDMQQAALVHATSEAEADDLRRLAPGSRVRVLPLGVDMPEFDREAAAAAFRDRFPQLNGKRVLVFLSRLAPKKRPELAVEALALLRHEHPDTVLLFAGQDSGSLEVVRKTAQRLQVEEAVILAGFLQGEWKRGALAAADVFVLPSLDENFGVAVVEAMAHGVPCVVTRGVATHVYVDASGGGETAPGSPRGLADAVGRVLAGDPQAAGAAAREFVRENLSWPVIGARLEAMYSELVPALVAVP